jgi:hypothetical protein
MKKIPFDIRYKAEIESGKYKVQTRDGRDARIICWDKKGKFPVVAIVKYYCGEEECFPFTNTGNYSSCTESDYDLFILTDEPELTPFEQAIEEIYESCGVKKLRSKDKAKELLDIAKKEILKDMPKWRKYGNGACGGGNFPIAICKVGCGYRLVESLVSGDEYIMLSDLEKLPKED